tara:strand:- start:160 stop:360 length:201 start_codon:yes stop_codon:yes gene_type:complete
LLNIPVPPAEGAKLSVGGGDNGAPIGLFTVRADGTAEGGNGDKGDPRLALGNIEFAPVVPSVAIFP